MADAVGMPSKFPAAVKGNAVFQLRFRLRGFCALLLSLGLTAAPSPVHGQERAEAPAEAAGAAKAAHGGHDAHHEHIGAADVSEDPSEFKGDLAIYTFVVFLLLLGLLWAFAWGPIVQGLEKREAGIHSNIAAAEQARIQAEQMLAEHERRLAKVQDEVREIIAEARRDADHTKQEIVATAQQEAEATRKRAIVEIRQARDTALKDLFDAMSRQVTSATEHVLGRSVNDDDHHRLVEEALSQFRR